MIEKIKVYGETPSGYKHPENKIQDKINELVDAVNGILAAQEQYTTIYNEDIVPMLTPKNVQPDYVTTSYMTNGHTKEYYGQKGASIVTDYPLPEGYVITIKEPETKDGNNE